MPAAKSRIRCILSQMVLTPWLTVNFSRQKVAEPGNQAHHLVERVRLAWQFLFVQDVGRFPPGELPLA